MSQTRMQKQLSKGGKKENNNLQELLCEPSTSSNIFSKRKKKPKRKPFLPIFFNEFTVDNNQDNEQEEKINQFDKQEEEIEQYNKQMLNELDNYAGSNIIDIIDVRSAQHLCKTTIYQPPKFPHPAYAQYMEIVMKHHLSDSI
ncbi:4841_t:CDS:2, partial [Gigaspora margarita]